MQNIYEARIIVGNPFFKSGTLYGTVWSFLMGETEHQNILKDPVMFKRIADIESLPEKDREYLLLTVDNFIKATKLSLL